MEKAAPLPVSGPFVRHCWYVIAWDHEVPADGLFSRTVLGEPILLYRTAAGQVVALQDRCCHRAAPLSLGRKEGDCVRCGYHGLKFDASGACVEVPGLAQVPPKACVRSYPCRVHRRWVLVWMGDSDKANPALLPDNFSNEHPQWHYRPGYLHYNTAQARNLALGAAAGEDVAMLPFHFDAALTRYRSLVAQAVAAQAAVT